MLNECDKFLELRKVLLLSCTHNLAYYFSFQIIVFGLIIVVVVDNFFINFSLFYEYI